MGGSYGTHCRSTHETYTHTFKEYAYFFIFETIEIIQLSVYVFFYLFHIKT